MDRGTELGRGLAADSRNIGELVPVELLREHIRVPGCGKLPPLWVYTTRERIPVIWGSHDRVRSQYPRTVLPVSFSGARG